MSLKIVQSEASKYPSFVEEANPSFVLIVEEDSSPVFTPVEVPEKFVASIDPKNVAPESNAYSEDDAYGIYGSEVEEDRGMYAKDVEAERGR